MQQHAAKPAFVGLIPHGQVGPCPFVNNALAVGKRVKARLAVINVHAALTSPAEAHAACGKMNDRIVDTASADSCVW